VNEMGGTCGMNCERNL